jgi:NarL family two-component system sensor histidine kinase YdfH
MNKRKTFELLRTNADGDNVIVTRIPIILWILIVGVVALVLQNIIEKPLLFQSFLFIAVMIVHTFIYSKENILLSKSKSWYLIIQALLIFGGAIVLPAGLPAVLIGLIPILIGQSLTFFDEPSKVVLVSFALYLIFCLIVLWFNGSETLPIFIPMFLLMTVVVVAYAKLYYQQVNARVRTQTFLRDLEMAHRKVEDLTLANERQRMARDLHDTLAQGLAGLIMQLEAVDAYLGREEAERAHKIVLKSMGQARQTLADARRAIDDLRNYSTPTVNFNEAFNEQIIRFNQATGISIKLEGQTQHPLTGLQTEHLLYILSESLFNVARHAHASKVIVMVRDTYSNFYMLISDNGSGFNTEKIGKGFGHYGLIGLYERSRLIGGEIQINSDSNGTTIELTLPIVQEG